MRAEVESDDAADDVRVALTTRVTPVVGARDALAADARERREALPVAVVSMPFALPTRPSAQTGLLAAIASSHGFPVTQHSAFLDFAAMIGMETFVQLAGSMRPQIGDWLFARAAFDEDPDPDHSLVRDVGADVLAEASGRSIEWLLEVRERLAPAFVEDLLDGHDWGRYAVVGFTSTFQQNVASFALARRIKQRWPATRILFGGANFDGVMGPEWMRTMPFIDIAVTGEGDRAFPALLNALADGADLGRIPGVLHRTDAATVVAGPDPVPLEDLDELPIPDYAEYFERGRALGVLGPGDEASIEIPYESSRGCWWGEKMTCTFCGLNGSTMRYRSKRPERVMHELATLTRRHGSFMFFATDNILDLDYLDGLLRPLSEAQTGYWLFYEVKTTLDRHQMQHLYDAGVRALQPGIDSLSGHVLRLMRKGTRLSDNVNLLRWARYLGIDLYWNLLWGFPGELEADYEEQARLIRTIVHLQPAGGGTRIDLDRFSPYFEGRDEFPVRGTMRPHLGHRHTYPAEVDLARAAYHFEGELEGSLPDAAIAPMVTAHARWLAAWAGDIRPSLRFEWAPGVLRIDDRRSSLASEVLELGDPDAAVYRAMSDRAVTPDAIAAATGLGSDDIGAALDRFVARGLALRDGRLHPALAIPAVGGCDEAAA